MVGARQVDSNPIDMDFTVLCGGKIPTIQMYRKIKTFLTYATHRHPLKIAKNIPSLQYST